MRNVCVCNEGGGFTLKQQKAKLRGDIYAVYISLYTEMSPGLLKTETLHLKNTTEFTVNKHLFDKV